MDSKYVNFSGPDESEWGIFPGVLPWSSAPLPEKKDITFYDELGRPFLVSREEWAEKVLPLSIEKLWNDYASLAELVSVAIELGFAEEVQIPARHLLDSDPNIERRTAIWGEVLTASGNPQKATRFLSEEYEKGSRAPSVLYQFARAHYLSNYKKISPSSIELLKESLRADPNTTDALLLFISMGAAGVEGETTASCVEYASSLENSWLPQLLSVHLAIEHSSDKSTYIEPSRDVIVSSLKKIADLETDGIRSLGLGDFSTESYPLIVPNEFLSWSIFFLGSAGFLALMTELLSPLYDAQTHGVKPGYFIAKAHLNLGQFESARSIICDLQDLAEPEWSSQIADLESELCSLDISVIEIEAGISSEVFLVEGPLWCQPDSPSSKILFPHATHDKTIGILGSTIEERGGAPRLEEGFTLANWPSVLSRGVPLLLAEVLYASASVRTFAIFSRFYAPDSPGAFGVFKTPLSPEGASLLCQEVFSQEDSPLGENDHIDTPEYIVCSTIVTNSGVPVALELRIINIKTSIVEASFTESFSVDAPFSPESPCSLQAALKKLTREIVSYFSPNAPRPHPLSELWAGSPSTENEDPTDEYILRLEQSLTSLATAVDYMKLEPRFSPVSARGAALSIEGMLHYAADNPSSVCARLLLLELAKTMAIYRPSLVEAYLNKINIVQRENPLEDKNINKFIEVELMEF